MKYFGFIFFLFLGQCLSAQESDLYREIDKIIRYDTEIPYPLERSFIVGVIQGDSTYVLNFGDEHIDTFDLFEVGGLTKVFTATLATELDLRGLIDVDSTVNSYLPSRFRNPKLAQYTLADLMMHRIRFPKRPANLSTKEYNISDPYAFYSKEDVLSYYSSFQPPGVLKRVGRSVGYSHINYAVLEIILENEMKMPLEDLYQAFVFSDLGMMKTSLRIKVDDLSVGYDRANMIPDPWTYESFAGSEGLVTCMNDLLLFMHHSLSAEKQMIYESQRLRKSSVITKKLAHTYAWYVMNSKRTGPLYTHSGVTERHKAYMHYQKENKTGVIILCQSSVGVGELGMLILRMINNNWK